MSPTAPFCYSTKWGKNEPRGCGPLEPTGFSYYRFALWQRRVKRGSSGGAVRRAGRPRARALQRNAACCGGGFTCRNIALHHNNECRGEPCPSANAAWFSTHNKIKKGRYPQDTGLEFELILNYSAAMQPMGQASAQEPQSMHLFSSIA